MKHPFSLRTKKALTGLLLLFTLAHTAVFALSVPSLTGPVVDQANILQVEDREKLETYIRNAYAQTGVQVAVLTITSLEGGSLEDYSMQVADAWKLGNEKDDKGALLLVSLNDRAVRIEVGYGLEGLLTDAKSGLIIRNVIIPNFRNGDYSKGIVEGVTNIIGIGSENAEILSPAMQEGSGKSEESGSFGAGIIFFIIFFLLMSKGSGRRGNGLFWLLFLSGLSSHRPGSGSSSGHSTGGFGSGGGFSGGGGGFGGGGASGSW